MGGKESRGKHKERLCKLAKAEKFDAIIERSRHPAFICTKCGRVADREEHLCHPRAFD